MLVKRKRLVPDGTVRPWRRPWSQIDQERRTAPACRHRGIVGPVTVSPELNGAVRLWTLAIILALVAAACSPGSDETASTSTTAATSTTSTSTTTTVPPTSSTTVPTSTTTQAVGASFEIEDCSEPGDFALLCEAVEIIDTHFVDDVDAATLAEAAARGAAEADSGDDELEVCAIPDDAFVSVCNVVEQRGSTVASAVEQAVEEMVASLDPNSFYLDSQGLALVEEEQQGQIEGIGALVATEDLTADDPASSPCSVISDTCRLVIVSTLEGPAERAGIMPGDTFVEIDGRPIDGWTVDEVTSQVRGPAGSDVNLTMLRDGDRITFTITRAAIEIPVAEWEMIGDDVGYLRLFLFVATADEKVNEGLEALTGAGAKTIVFDLRNNPGGSLDSAVGVASEFLDDGLVLITIEPDEETEYSVREGGAGTDEDLEVIVVLNRGSASASEVVAGVLRERDRAVLVGERSFGKNTVQQRFGLSNGGAIRLTIARWTTPEGLDFGSTGLAPDAEGDFDTSLTPAEVTERALELAGRS